MSGEDIQYAFRPPDEVTICWQSMSECVPPENERLLIAADNRIFTAYYSGGRWVNSCDFVVNGVHAWSRLPFPPLRFFYKHWENRLRNDGFTIDENDPDVLKRIDD